MMSGRFLSSLAISLALHAGIIAASGLARLPVRQHPAAKPAPLLAELRPRPAQHEAPPTALLKNTLDEGKPSPAARRAAVGKGPGLVRARSADASAAQRKLAQHLFYPPEAISQGLEGEVRLLLTLDDSGRVTDVSVASGSGHRLLDDAAVKAAWAMGRLSAAGARELILPVEFRLQ